MIGLLTFQDTNNFGACLQAIALFTKVKQLGFDIEIINYRNQRIYENEVLSLRPKLSPKKLIKWLLLDRKMKKRYFEMRREFNGLVNLSDKVYTIDNIKDCAVKYDTLLVGSDQVWSLSITGFDYTYYLDFAGKNNRKISFSSSISDEKSFKSDQKAQSLLKQFDRISVREESAKKLIEQTINKEAEWVCDPTMLYTREQWENIISPQQKEGDYVLIYFVDPEKRVYRDALTYAKRHGYKVLYCSVTPLRRGIKSVVPQTMAEWLGLIKHAKALFTSSYHGLLFGLYFNKPLIYYNREPRSRMESIIRLCGIEQNDGTLNHNGNIPQINYNKVNATLDKFRLQSEEFLTNLIKSNSDANRKQHN